MVSPPDGWHAFVSDDEQFNYLRDHKLIAPTATSVKQFFYSGIYTKDQTPCTIVGYVDHMFLVIQINSQLHSIHADRLMEMQPTAKHNAASEEDDDGLDAVEQGKVVDRSIQNYTVIDLETTGLSCYTDEIIEFAAIRVRKGQITDTFSSLAKCTCCIPAKVTKITGICNADLSDAPDLPPTLLAYLSFIGDDIVVGHNIQFDVRFLNEACKRLGIPSPTNDMIDTLRSSRKRMRLESYKLSAVREALGLPKRTEHRALSDCETTMDVYEALKKIPTLSASGGSAKQAPKKASRARFRAAPLERRPELYPTEIVTGESSPFWEADCVLTGELHIERKEAEQMIRTAGGVVKSSVSRKTKYLIVGRQDKALVGEDGLSSKEEKALAINASGKGHIQMINEEQFCKLLAKEGVANG